MRCARRCAGPRIAPCPCPESSQDRDTNPLDSWTHAHTSTTRDGGVTHPTYRKGRDPGVTMIHEIPGMIPEVIDFAEEVAAVGCPS